MPEQENLPDVEAAIERALRGLGLRRERELAEWLGVDPTALSKWKKRGIPDEMRNRFEEAMHAPSRRELESHYSQLDRTTRDPSLVYVPFLNITVSAGPGILGDEYETPHSLLAFRKDWIESVIGGRHVAAVAVKVKGDSMADAIADGDVVLVDTTTTNEQPNQVFVLRTRDGLKVKRVLRRGQTWWATSDNPKTSDEEWREFRLDADVAIRGRVFWRGGIL